MSATTHAQHFAMVDVTGRDICTECPGDDPTCFLCHGTAFVDDPDHVDAEDVSQPVHGATSVRHHVRPGRAADTPATPREPIAVYMGVAFAAGVVLALIGSGHVPAMRAFAAEPVEQVQTVSPEEDERIAQLAEYASWTCAQVKLEYRLTSREYKWCSRERTDR